MSTLREAAEKALATLTDPRIGQWSYMEGSEIYSDFSAAAEALRAALAKPDAPTVQDEPAPQMPEALRDSLQRRCVEWGAYWRAPDAHGVDLTQEQAVELLQDALGVEVAIATAQAPAGPSDERILLAVTSLFPRWREDIQERFVLEVARTVLGLTAESSQMRAPLESACAALEEAQTYVNSPSWSPSMAEECRRAEETGRAALSQPAAPGAPTAQAPTSATVSEAARDVLAERRRQVEAEGWTPQHDDEHNEGTLAQAGACYARWAYEGQQMPNLVPTEWPWADEWWKPTTPRRALVKACALILAEIERRDRVRAAEPGKGE